ncbi:MAG: hypothetical protein QW209_06545 [Nitrososphaerota archaeon]
MPKIDLIADYNPKSIVCHYDRGESPTTSVTVNYSVSWDATDLPDTGKGRFCGVLVSLHGGLLTPSKQEVIFTEKKGSKSGSLTIFWDGSREPIFTACVLHFVDPGYPGIPGPECHPQATKTITIPINVERYVGVLVQFERPTYLKNNRVTIQLDGDVRHPSTSPELFRDVLLKPEKTVKVIWEWDETDFGGGDIEPAGSRVFSTTLGKYIDRWPAYQVHPVWIRAIPDKPFPPERRYFDAKVELNTKVYVNQNVALRISILGGKSPYTITVTSSGIESWTKTVTSYSSIFAYDFDYRSPGTAKITVTIIDADGRKVVKEYDVVITELPPPTAPITPLPPPTVPTPPVTIEYVRPMLKVTVIKGRLPILLEIYRIEIPSYWGQVEVFKGKLGYSLLEKTTTIDLNCPIPKGVKGLVSVMGRLVDAYGSSISFEAKKVIE